MKPHQKTVLRGAYADKRKDMNLYPTGTFPGPAVRGLFLIGDKFLSFYKRMYNSNMESYKERPTGPEIDRKNPDAPVQSVREADDKRFYEVLEKGRVLADSLDTRLKALREQASSTKDNPEKAKEGRALWNVLNTDQRILKKGGFETTSEDPAIGEKRIEEVMKKYDGSAEGNALLNQSVATEMGRLENQESVKADAKRVVDEVSAQINLVMEKLAAAQIDSDKLRNIVQDLERARSDLA